jgi:hypothetical protein
MPSSLAGRSAESWRALVVKNSKRDIEWHREREEWHRDREQEEDIRLR